MGRKQIFIDRMRYLCDEADLGYDQSNRWAVYEHGETDCSALVYDCLWYAGYAERPDNPWNHTLFTGTMDKDLQKIGFKKLPNNGKPEPGDILLNYTHHVAVCTAPGLISQASIDERGKISGGQTGDQSGKETNTRSYYNYPWDAYYRPPADDEPLGWILDDNGWWWRREDGSYPKSEWMQDGNFWYYLKKNGYAATNWTYIGDDWYYFRTKDWPTCSMYVGWLWDGAAWYYLRENEKDGHPKGSMARNEVIETDGQKWAVGEDGRMLTGMTPAGALYVDDRKPE